MRERSLRLIAVAALGGLSLLAAGAPVAADGAKWTCSAAKLKRGSYTGGKTATIHLSPYKSGGKYPVTLVSETEVTGVTKDGTRFTCVKS